MVELTTYQKSLKQAVFRELEINVQYLLSQGIPIEDIEEEFRFIVNGHKFIELHSDREETR